MIRHLRLWASMIVLAAASVQPVSAQGTALPVLEVSTFPAPTAAYWFPQLISKLGLDRKHGFTLVLQPKSSQVAYSDFVSGTNKVCYCIATAAGERFVERGARISQVWINESASLLIVTANPDIKTFKDLEGKTLGADTVTGAWALSAALLKHRGVDLGKVKIQSGSFSKTVSELVLGRIDAASLSKSSLNLFIPKEPGKYTILNLTDSEDLRKATNGRGVPLWGLGAWNDWVDIPGNQVLLRSLYAASKDLNQLIAGNREEAAKLIADLTKQDPNALLWELQNYWKDDLAPAKTYEAGIRLLGSQLLPDQKVLDRPLTEDEFKTFISPLEF